MGTLNQKKAAKETARRLEAGERVKGGEILKDAGYTGTVIANPKGVFASKGFLEELEKLGFSTEAADTKVSEILKGGEDRNALKAAELIYKRKGAFVPEIANGTQINFFLSPETSEAAKQFEDTLKKQLYAKEIKETETIVETKLSD